MLFNWATPKYLQYNPAASLKILEPPRESPEPNRTWTDEECDIMLSEAKGGLRVALALGLYAALRTSIIVELLWSDYDGTAIECRFNNEETWRQPVNPELKTILDGVPRNARTIITSELGRPYTWSGLEHAFRRLRDRLVAEGKLNPGLTFEGLRHTAGKRLSERGVDPRVVARALRHKSLAAAMRYLEEADRKPRADAVTNAFELVCPRCGGTDRIDVASIVWVRLTPEGVDPDLALGPFGRNDTGMFQSESPAACRRCAYTGTVEDFEIE